MWRILWEICYQSKSVFISFMSVFTLTMNSFLRCRHDRACAPVNPQTKEQIMLFQTCSWSSWTRPRVAHLHNISWTYPAIELYVRLGWQNQVRLTYSQERWALRGCHYVARSRLVIWRQGYQAAATVGLVASVLNLSFLHIANPSLRGLQRV